MRGGAREERGGFKNKCERECQWMKKERQQQIFERALLLFTQITLKKKILSKNQKIN